MRNLKRALSLAVASVMLLGMMVVGTGASYADVTSEENQEAIEVLQAVGIMTGDDQGNFNPDQNVTRNEMAVIMCNLMDYTVSSYAGTAPFTDVPSWAEPYVAACWTHSITGGTSATTYGGDESVTTSQAALMLMKALGYFQYQSDFGSDWQVATVSKGSQIGIFDDIDTAAAEALTRNDVARMVLNALETPMVDATGDGGTTITGEGFEITTGKATYEERTSSNSDYGQIDDERSTATNGRYIIQLGEDLYDGDLRKSTEQDDFGRPGTAWTYKGTDIGTYADSADDVLVLNKNRTAEQALVTDSDYFDYALKDLADDGYLNLYINGDAEFEDGDYADLANVSLLAGDQIELYENDDNEVETISVIRYSLAVIKEVEDNISSTYTNQGATYAITLETLSETGIGGTYYDVYDSDSARELKGFAASTYTEGTVLAVAMNQAETILASNVAESVSGSISKYNSGSKANVTIGDTDYPLHGVVDTSNNTNVAMGSLNPDLNDSEYTVYLDRNGYVVGVDESGAAKIEDVYYVTGIVRDTSRYTDFYAQAVSLYDGTITEFKLNSDSSENTTAFGASWTTDGGYEDGSHNSVLNTKYSGLYTFEKDGSGYNAEVYNSDTDSTYYVFDGSSSVTGTNVAKAAGILADDLARDDGNMTIGSNKVYLNSNTNYVKIETPGSDIDVDFVTGGTSVDKATSTLKALAIATKSSNNYVASYVVLVNTAKFANASSDDVVFVHERSNSRTSYTDGDGKNQTAYNTELWFMDGSGNVETVMVKGSAKSVGFYTWEINDDGVYELTSADGDTALTNGNKSADSWTYEDETGWVGFVSAGADKFGTGAELTGIFNNALSAKGDANDGTYNDTVTLEDVDFAENVIIGDDRSKDDRDASAYSSEITSVSQLKTAIDKDNSSVYGVVYADNEEVIMVYVTSMTTAPGGDDDDVTPGAVGNVTATGNRELSDAISNDPGFSGLGITDTEIREAVNAMEITLEKGESKTDSDTGVTTTPITITGSIQKTDSLSKAWKDNAERYYLILNIEAPSTINATEVELGNGNTSDVEDGSFVLILGLSDVTNSHTVSMTWKDASGNEVKTAIVLDMYDLDFTEST